MLYLILGLVAYIAIAFVMWYTYTKKWERNTKFERVYFAIIWPLTGILYIAYLINKLRRLPNDN